MKTIIMVSVILLSVNGLLAQIAPEERAKIESAIPKKAFVQPQQSRKILVVNLHVRNGEIMKGHASIPHGNLAIDLMGKKTGAFEVIVNNDSSAFEWDYLQQFDAVCFNNTAGVLFTDKVLRQNLLDFIAQGKGFVGIHAAAATFVEWPVYHQFPAFGEMLGAYEDMGHPWKPDETITLLVEEPSHPLNQGFDQRTFEIQDEVFQFRTPYSRDQLRILLTIDTEQTDMNPDRRFIPARYNDRDFAMSWIREYGKGRVFYTSLGHNPHIFWDDALLMHILAGIQYATGDLDADATPSHLKD
ncbi:hypothetical protein GF406_18955 [candidate division KSB1 bacterium]|nr:hypothetical protein [candidate division KSB1 bacterium]